MDTSGPADTRLLAPNAGSARTVSGSSSKSCSVASCLCAFIVDFLTAIFLIVLAPVLLCILGLLCLIPILDRLMHPGRKYMDGTSSAYVNHLPEGVIHGMIVSCEPVSAETVFAKFQETYSNSARPEFHAFQQRMVQTKVVWPYWADAQLPFDESYHFRKYSEPITKVELEAKVAQIQNEILDFERPLWQLWHFENFTDEDGTAASVTMLKIHHCVCDGFTGMRMVMQGANPNKPPANNTVASGRAEARRRPGFVLLLHYWFVSLRKLLFMQADAPSAFKSAVRLTPKDPRTVAWSTLKNSTVSSLKDLGKSLNGATINDILLAALAGALRRHSAASPTQCLANDLTACGWVSQSPLKHIYTDFDEVPFKWGNSTLGAFYVALPVGANRQGMSSIDALNSLRETTNNPALMVEAGVATKLLGMFGWLPFCVGKMLWGPLANKVSVSMSNVPGPQFETEWCGNKVRRMLFFVPPSGSISLFCTIATWNGEVNVGMGIDSSLLGQDALRSITGEHFEAEIEELRRQVGAQA